jgi:hypothetical protein
MKSTVPVPRILLGATFAAALLATTHAAEPPQLTALRQSYQQARTRVTEPIDTRYRQDLQRLLEASTRAGKLDEALAVKAEMDQVPGARRIFELLTNNVWVHQGQHRYIFRRDGRFELEGSGRKGSFKVDEEKGTVTFNWDSPNEGLKLVETHTSMLVHSNGGTWEKAK